MHATTPTTSTRMPRLATAAVGLGAATCLVLLPSAALAAPNGHASERAQAGGSHSSGVSQGAEKRATKAERSGEDRRAVQLHDQDTWQAQADPDGAENGGVDQPGGTGGTIGQQDGNNGSGNDADCEDDNRGQGVPGHCTPRTQEPQQPEQPEQPGQPGGSEQTTPGSEQVSPPAVSSGVSAGAGDVAAAQAVAGPSAARLPDTGSGDALAWLTLGGLAAVAAGSSTVVAARRR